MDLTPEQQTIISSSGNIKINAVAGSGKTTTIIEYAKARSKNAKILYLAFNRSVKTEAVKKFEENIFFLLLKFKWHVTQSSVYQKFMKKTNK